MKSLYKAVLFSIIISCQSNFEKTNQKAINQKLIVNYTGEADVVQFKMFEGLSQVLKKDTTTGAFEGILEIPNLNEAIFTYDIVVHKKDKSGRMLEVEPKNHSIKLNKFKAIEKEDLFLWIGKNRNGDYLENEVLLGSLTSKSMKSGYLGEEREITVYTPKKVNSKIPHIYFTDGSIVSYYAPYVDRLISTKKIRPIRLIGIHSSSTNRYNEYVQGGEDNELFEKHENFIYQEVLNTIEKEIENWAGKRYIVGFSNGAAFCMHAGINHPNVFEEIIAFSTVDYISSMAQMINPVKFESGEYPKFYMGAGRYETRTFNDNIKFIDKMKENDLQVNFKEFISGHDYNVWRIEFLEYLESRFKN